MVRVILRWFLAVLYFSAGIAHLAAPDFFVAVTPPWVPMPEAVIFWTGIAEIAGAIALVQPLSMPLRRLSGRSLAAYALCVWPANINHMMMDLALPGGGAGLGYHIARMIAQPLLIWAALWASCAIDWPWHSRRSHRDAAHPASG